MINIDGHEFSSLEDAQEYLDSKKREELEAKEKKQTRKDSIAQFLSNNFYMMTVVRKEGNWVVCVVCDNAEKAKRVLRGNIEDLFGRQYEWNEDIQDFDVNYTVVAGVKASASLKAVVADKLSSGEYVIHCGRIQTIIEDATVNESKFRAIVFESFGELPEELALDSEGKESDEESADDSLEQLAKSLGLPIGIILGLLG